MNADMKTLEALVRSAIARIRSLEQENSMLRRQVESYAADRDKLMKAGKGSVGAEARKKLRKRLLRLCERIENLSSPQGLLFTELDDE